MFVLLVCCYGMLDRVVLGVIFWFVGRWFCGCFLVVM